MTQQYFKGVGIPVVKVEHTIDAWQRFKCSVKHDWVDELIPGYFGTIKMCSRCRCDYKWLTHGQLVYHK